MSIGRKYKKRLHNNTEYQTVLTLSVIWATHTPNTMNKKYEYGVRRMSTGCRVFCSFVFCIGVGVRNQQRHPRNKIAKEPERGRQLSYKPAVDTDHPSTTVFSSSESAQAIAWTYRTRLQQAV